jgi:Carbon-nitrogen hydrolase
LDNATRRRVNGVAFKQDIQQERYIEMAIVKAAAVQISPVLYRREGTVEKVVEKIVALGREGVQFATFPEAIVPYYPYFSTLQRPIDWPTNNCSCSTRR